jgi:hypothetical protein
VTKRILVLGLVFVLAAIAAGCASAQAASTASCEFVVGNGAQDARLHHIVYPGQAEAPNTNESVSYVPCNSRNYIINDGNSVNANGEKVGDRPSLIEATTSTGVHITIAARALWTLNESDRALREFYNVCFKYTCASDKDIAGTTNSSTPGWNRMLAENFGPTMDSIGRSAAFTVQDTIWSKADPTQYKALADAMSASFANVMRVNLGYPDDLFCGSGNSAWSDPNRPGEGQFTCNPVRIAVDDVRLAANQGGDNSAGATALNQQRLALAQALYGPQAAYWLALQDTVAKCDGHCTVNFLTPGTSLQP